MTRPVQRILIGGASGLIGSGLVSAARRQSIEVTRLVRQRTVDADEITWNPGDETGAVDPSQLEGFDAVVHLSGASIARRWTAQYRQELANSRVGSTRILCRVLPSLRKPPRVVVVASGLGIYGDRGDEILTEQSRPGTGFLAELSLAWEGATRPVAEAGISVVHLRFGVVFDLDGGALARMLPAFRMGLGGRLGSGQQWMSWISLRDALRAILFLVNRDDSAGPFNICSPGAVTNREFTRALAGAVRRPAVLPVPAAALRLMFGTMADQTLLASQRAMPQSLAEAGFTFEDEEIGATLRALLG